MTVSKAENRIKVLDVSYSYSDSFSTPEAYLNYIYYTGLWKKSYARQGLDLVFAGRFKTDFSDEKQAVYLYKDVFKGKPRFWQIPFAFHRKIKQWDADIIHVHGIIFPIQLFFLRLLLNRKTKIVVQHQGGLPQKKWIQRVKNFFLSVADGFFFTTREQGLEWFSESNPKLGTKVFPLVESSTDFSLLNRESCRLETKISGEPAFLWVGTLDANKDPFTILRGFELVKGSFVHAKLFMVYANDTMLTAVQRIIIESKILTGSVILLGKKERKELEKYYNSADYFVLGSYREGSGYSMIEAMACGCIPIVTNIPSFKLLTGNGSIGSLFEPGNAASFYKEAITVLARNKETESKKCRAFFENNFSFDSLAKNAKQHYKALLES